MASTVSACESPSRRAVSLPPSSSSEARERDLRQVEALRELGRDQGRFAVGGGHAGDDEVCGGVRAEVADGCGQGQGGGGGVGPGQRVVAEVDAFGGADLQGLLHRVDSTGGTHAQGDDLVAGRFPAAGLDQLECGLEGVLVQFGQDALGAVRRVALAGEVPVELGVRDVLDQHDDLQCLFHCVYSSLPCGWTASRVGSWPRNARGAGLLLANHIGERRPRPGLRPVSGPRCAGRRAARRRPGGT